MDFEIKRVTAENYSMFTDMVSWRRTGRYTESPSTQPEETVEKELQNPDLYVYAAQSDGRFVGWISLVYIPKIGKWGGRGHIYVDELWVQEDYRRRGIAKALLAKADCLKEERNAHGIRLYVNVNNPEAGKLYDSCGYREDGTAKFMEK